MNETTAPLGPELASSPAAAPHWRRRLDTSAGVIDTAAARRLYERTARWAIQRIVRAGDLAARHACTDQAGPAAALLLARVPVQTSDQGQAEGSAGALGVGRAQGEVQLHGSSSGSMLAARVGSAPPAMHLARRMDPGRGDAVGGGHSITARPATAGTRASATPEAGPAVRSAASAAASSHDAVGTTLPLARPNAGGASETGVKLRPAASTLQRKVSDRHIDLSTRSTQAPASLARAREVAPLASAQHGIDTMLHLARESTSDAQPPPNALSRSNADAKASLSQPEHDLGASVSAAATTPAARPIIARAMDVTPLALSVVQQLSSRPLMRARMPDVAAASTHGAPARAVVERPIGHAAEISIAAPAVPTLVWRATDDAGVRDRASRFADAGSTGVPMRAGAEAIEGAAAASSASTSVSSAIQTDAAASAAPLPPPDVNQLAERVTRLIVRRFEVECERRGGKRWN